MTSNHPDCLIDGIETDKVPADDRGLRYGDGLFETLAVFGGCMPLWEFHMARLARDAARLGLVAPDPKILEADCRRLIADCPDVAIRITLTRGSGGQGYFPPEQAVPRRIVQRLALPRDMEAQQRDGIAAVFAEVRLPARPQLAGIKHLNRLEQVLAARQCAGSGAHEALMADIDGRLIEALTGNLLLVFDGQLVTPEMFGAGVAGVGLAWLASMMPDIDRRVLAPDDLPRATEIMVINSVRGIRPVTRLEGRVLEPGAQCRRLQSLWSQHVCSESSSG